MGGAPQSILLSAPRRGPVFGIGCGLAFRVAFGFGRSAVVSLVPVIRLFAVLVSVVPPGGGFACPCFGLYFGRVRCWFWSFRLAVVSFVPVFGFYFGRVRCWFWSFRLAVVSFVLVLASGLRFIFFSQ